MHNKLDLAALVGDIDLIVITSLRLFELFKYFQMPVRLSGPKNCGWSFRTHLVNGVLNSELTEARWKPRPGLTSSWV